jgi:hypothetical protein
MNLCDQRETEIIRTGVPDQAAMGSRKHGES